MSVPFSTLNRTVLITGGANGLGLAMAREFAARKGRLILCDVSARLPERVEELRSAGAPCIGIRCDVSSAAEVEATFERAWQEFGPIDITCANAGVVRTGPLLQIDQRDIDWVFAVNTFGVLNCARSYVRRLRGSGHAGQLLITGSEHSLSNPLGSREFLPQIYNVSKHATLAIADLLRAELATEAIGVSILCPHAFESNLGENSREARPAQFAARADAPKVRAAPPSAAALVHLQQLRSSAQYVAQIALRGLEHGAFIIPTHTSVRDDVERRHADILQGFTLLNAMPAGP